MNPLKNKQLLLLGLGLLLACGLAKLGTVQKLEGRPVSGYEATHARETVTVCGTVQTLREGSGGGFVADFRAEDGTPLKVWVGPDCPRSQLALRARLRLTGRDSGGLFVVASLERDTMLSESQTYRAHKRGKWAYLSRGGKLVRVRSSDLPDRNTVEVSRFGRSRYVE